MQTTVSIDMLITFDIIPGSTRRVSFAQCGLNVWELGRHSFSTLCKDVKDPSDECVRHSHSGSHGSEKQVEVALAQNWPLGHGRSALESSALACGQQVGGGHHNCKKKKKCK